MKNAKQVIKATRSKSNKQTKATQKSRVGEMIGG